MRVPSASYIFQRNPQEHIHLVSINGALWSPVYGIYIVPRGNPSHTADGCAEGQMGGAYLGTELILHRFSRWVP